MRQDNYKNSRPEPSTRKGSGPVLLEPAVVEQQLGLEQGVEKLDIEQLVTEVFVEGLDLRVCQGAPGSMSETVVPLKR
jgi:hypothetical protein